MIPRSLSLPSLLRIGVVFLLYSVCLTSTSFAQEEDPYTIPPEERRTASTPLPAGVIINLSYPVWGAAVDNEADQGVDIEKFLRYDIFGYVDGWQLGYSRQPYGTAWTIMPRSIGRDAYTGWYFLLGSQSGEQASAQFPNGVDYSRTMYGFGSKIVSGFDTEVKFAYEIDVLIGVAIGNDIVIDDEVTGEAGSNFVLKTGGSVGARIPVGISGTTLGAYGDLLVFPDPNNINGNLLLQIELGLKLTGAFNMNL